MADFNLKARLADKTVPITISAPDCIYFMGVCGTAMASLAIYLRQKKFKIFGSDQNIYPPMSSNLKKNGISVSPYNEKNIDKSIKLIIVGNVISPKHPEVQMAESLNIPYLSFPEFLKQTVLSQTKNIVLTGTHGKSTSTALMSHIGEISGQNPSFFFGAVSKNFSQSFRSTSSPWFVIEGDEYDSSFFAKQPKFIYYNPYAVLLTGVEFDHGDIYDSLDTIINWFCKFVKKIPEKGFLVAHTKNKQLQKIIKHSKAPVITYGIDQGDWTIKNRRFEKNFQLFDIQHKKESYSCTLPLLGEHNAVNALGVFVLAYTLGWPTRKILQALKSFKGLKRRMEYKGQFKGVKIYEDFAHHPTAIKAGLSALKEAYPNNRLIALFEPRSFTSRLNIFQKDYVKAFAKADIIFLAKAYDSSKIPEEKRLSLKQLVQALNQREQLANSYDDFEVLEEELFKIIKKDDIIVFMSSGAFGGLLEKIEKKLS